MSWQDPLKLNNNNMGKVNILFHNHLERLDAGIAELNKERAELEKQIEAVKDKKGIDTWRGFRFESSSGLTDEFRVFYLDFKKYIKDECKKNGLEVVSIYRGHFFLSGFVKNPKTLLHAYFSISDVRYFPDDWTENILIRTAKRDKDFTGGANQNTSLPFFGQQIKKLTL